MYSHVHLRFHGLRKSKISSGSGLRPKFNLMTAFKPSALYPAKEMLGNVVYRQAEARDVAEVAAVHMLSKQAAYKDILAPDYLDSLSLEQHCKSWEEKFPKLANAQKYLAVAELDKKIIGFASTGPARDEGLPYGGELYTLYLHPDYYGYGVGRFLMQMCGDYLVQSGTQGIYLWVFEGNQPGRVFYEKMGGVCVPGKTKIIDIGSQSLVEVLYGWQDLTVLCGHHHD